MDFRHARSTLLAEKMYKKRNIRSIFKFYSETRKSAKRRCHVYFILIQGKKKGRRKRLTATERV
jgi:hypothetical protein